MPQHYVEVISFAQPFRQLLSQIERAMLASSTTERHHQALKPAPLIFIHASIHKRHHACQKLMDALLLIQVLDHRSVPSGECFESFLPPRVWQATAVEDKTAAMPAIVFGHAAMERETYNPHYQV